MPFPDFLPTVPVFAREGAASHGSRTLLVSDGVRLAFDEADARSRELARGLLADGIGKGSRVGILMPNHAEWLIAWLAATRIGAVAVPLNTFYQTQELAGTLRHADVSHLLTYARFKSHDYLSRLEAALPELAGGEPGALRLGTAPYLRSIHVWGECDRSWASGGPAELAAAGASVAASLLDEVESCVTPADLITIVYSSGSTAEPKGAVHTQGGMVRHSYSLAIAMDVQPDDVLYSPMPFFWVGGLMTALFMCMHRGARCLTHGVFDAGGTLELLEKERVTYVMGWPHYGKSMAEHPSFASRDLSAVRRSNMAELLPPGKRPAHDGIRSNSLGMTETLGPHHHHDMGLDLPEPLHGTFGRPMDGIETRVVDPRTGAILGPGQEGEICIRGFTVMQSLYKREREEVLDPDGFYHTGDGGYVNEDGWLFFTGRLGEMIKTGGANVTPGEVETVLMGYPEVSEAYVTGIPDADRGELVAAAVVLRRGAEIDAEALRGRLRTDLSAYKIPRHVWVCDKGELPFTDSGKIRKPVLARLLAERAARA